MNLTTSFTRVSLAATLLLGASSSVLAQTQETVTFMALDVVNFRGALEQFIEEFESENPDVNIEANFTPQLTQQFLPLLMANDLSDITFIASGNIVPYMGSQRLTPVPEEFAATLDGVVSEAALEAVSRDGNLYGIPYNYYPTSGVIMFNEALWEEAGVDPVDAASWDDFMEQAQALTKRDASGAMTQSGFSAQRQPTAIFFAWLLQLGGQPFNADGTAAFNSEAGKQALQLYADIYNKWEVDDYEFVSTITGFNQEQVAASMVGPWYGSILAKDHPNISVGHVNQPPLPSVHADQPNYWPLYEVWTHLVSSDGAEKDGVWRFIEFLLQPEIAARWSQFSGEMPTVTEALPMPEVRNTPYLEPYVDAVDYAVTENIAIYYSRDVRDVTETMLEGVARGQVSVEEALSTAEAEVNRLTARMARR